MDFASESFLTYAAPYLRDCPTPLIAHHLKLASRDFFRLTRIYRLPFSINVVAGQAGYVIAPPAGFEVTAILEVRFEGLRIKPLTRDEALATFGEQWETTQSDSALNFVQADEGQMTLVPVPKNAMTAGLIGRYAAQPTLTGAGIPDAIFNKYAHIIGYGAIADLASIDGKPWTSAANAAKYASMYTTERNGVQVKVDRDFGERDVIATGILW